MAIVIKYTASEALQMVKDYYPSDWLKKIETNKNHLKNISIRHNISYIKAYEKFIMPLAQEYEAILFFVALNELMEIEKLSTAEKGIKITELQDKNQQVATQLFNLENSNLISHEDKKIIRSFYINSQQETTFKIDELIKSIEVVEPKLVIYQQGLFS